MKLFAIWILSLFVFAAVQGVAPIFANPQSGENFTVQPDAVMLCVLSDFAKKGWQSRNPKRIGITDTLGNRVLVVNSITF